MGQKSQYVTIGTLNAIIGDATKENRYLDYQRSQGTNEFLMYARDWIFSSSKYPKFAKFIAKGRTYGITRFACDYVDSSELAFWKKYLAYCGSDPAPKLDMLITEKEPYNTGDYAGFYQMLADGDVFAMNNRLLFASYQGHSDQDAFNEIVRRCDLIYLSWYVSMDNWNRTDHAWPWVRSRYERIANAGELHQKAIQVVPIMSAERITWGAKYDFMGKWFQEHSFYGTTWQWLTAAYDNNASAKVKAYTDQVGLAIFNDNYGMKAKAVKLF